MYGMMCQIECKSYIRKFIRGSSYDNVDLPFVFQCRSPSTMWEFGRWPMEEEESTVRCTQSTLMWQVIITYLILCYTPTPPSIILEFGRWPMEEGGSTVRCTQSTLMWQVSHISYFVIPLHHPVPCEGSGGDQWRKGGVQWGVPSPYWCRR